MVSHHSLCLNRHRLDGRPRLPKGEAKGKIVPNRFTKAEVERRTKQKRPAIGACHSGFVPRRLPLLELEMGKLGRCSILCFT